MYLFNIMTTNGISSFCQTGKVTSLYAMLEAYSYNYFLAGHAIGRAITELDLSNLDCVINPQENVPLMGIVAGFKSQCEKLDLKFTIEAVNRFLVCKDGPVKCSRVVDELGEIRRRAADELGSRLFLYLDTPKATLFSKEYPLGEEIETRFPTTSNDISEAAKCLALGRYTGAVFHFSRVLEFVLNDFHERLTGNPPAPKNTWGLTVALAKVYAGQLPSSAKVEIDKKRSASAVIDAFDSIKRAWRDPAVHDLGKMYTEEHAKNLMDRTKQACILTIAWMDAA